MATHDYVISNQSFPSTRTDINNVLQAIVSNNSNATAPSTTFANMIWYDTANNKLYIRNEDNDAWIELLKLDQTNDKVDEINVTTANISGDLTVDTDTLFVDASADAVGIGTTTPSSFGGNLVASGTGSIINARSSSGTSAIGIWEGVSSRFFLVSLNGSDGLAFVDGDGSSERMRILSGGGLTFNGDTAAANALDDYEEGTFSPAYAFTSGGSFTHNIQLGRYTKIGRVVHCTGRVRGAKSSSGSGAVNVTGFPFTSGSTANLHASGVIGRTGNFTNAPKSLFMGTGSTIMAMRQINSSSNTRSNVSQDTVDGDMGTGANDNDLIFSITYMTD